MSEILMRVENLAKHYDVGKKVRQTIKELGGTMPEELPTPENIRESKKRIKQSSNKKLSKNVKKLNG